MSASPLTTRIGWNEIRNRAGMSLEAGVGCFRGEDALEARIGQSQK